MAIFLGGAITVLPVILTIVRPREAFTRHTASAALFTQTRKARDCGPLFAMTIQRIGYPIPMDRVE